jgi:hypothetical protein
MSSMPDDPKRGVIEGAEAAQRFEHTMHRVLSISKDELTKRENAYQKKRRAKKSRKTRTTR